MLDNLYCKIIRLQQWIVNHPRTSSSYLALFSSIVIASFIVLISTPKNISNTLQLAQAQTGLQVPLQQMPTTLNTTVNAIANATIPPATQASLAVGPATTATTTNVTNIKLVNSNNAGNINNAANVSNATTNNAATKVITVRNKDSLTKIFQRLKLNPKNAKAILALNNSKALCNLKAGKKLNFSLTPDQKLQQISYQIDPLNTLIVTASNNKFIAKIDHIEPTINLAFITTTVSGSVYKAAKKAGISGKLLAQITNIFKEKINLAKLRNGDQITILRKDYSLNGQKIKDSDLAIVELVNKGKSYKAIAYTDPTGHTDFYTPDGYTLKSVFMRYPVNFKYISSPFSWRRLQPLLGVYREHTGVDLAGTPGTPVKATSNGLVAFAGVDGGYGRIVIIKNGRYTTKYAHLKGFAKQIHSGSYVRQGQVIGYLGSSGLATGPHVHYEFCINGNPVNPAKVKLPVGEMIAKTYRGKFLSQAKTLLAQLNIQKHTYAANTNTQQATASKS